MELLPKMGGEPNITLSNNGDQNPMASNNLVNIHIGQLLGHKTLPNRQEVGTLGQSINGDPNSIETLCCLRQLGDEIHQNLLPFPHGNLQRL